MKNPPENKNEIPQEAENAFADIGTVKIRMKPGFALEGQAKPGEVVEVTARLADYLIKIGYATKEEE
jgi:hypothetical protein